MKIAILIVLTFFIHGLGDTESQYDDIYFNSLKLHITHFQELGEKLNINIEKVYIREVSYHSKYNCTINGVEIITINNKQLHELTRNGNKINLVLINPIECNNSDMYMYITNFLVKRKRKHYTMIGQDGSKIYLKYDCKKSLFQYKRIDS